MNRNLDPIVKLSVTLDAICSRNRYTSDPAPVVAELLETAGDRADVLAEAVGGWVGYFEDEYTQTLCTALRELPGLEEWILLGRFRRNLPAHGTTAELGHGNAYNLPLYLNE